MTPADLVGKRAVVTGAASGIGREIAVQLVAAGVRVVAADIAELGLNALREECGEAIVPVVTDVTDESAVERAVGAAVEGFGGLDLAFNVAGAGVAVAIVDTPVESWDSVVNLVQRGVFLSTKHEARAMLDGGGGAIVNIASLNAHMPLPLGSAYATAKAGVEMFSRNAALELSPLGIRVNAVLPGLVDTPATAAIIDADPLRANFTDRILLGRPATVAEIAEPCLFLASDAARYITGTSLVIDGGWEITNYPDLRKFAL